MLFEIVIGAVSNAPELSPAEREFEFEVRSCVGIETEFFFVVVAQLEFVFVHAEVEEPLFAEILPIREPLEVSAGFAEKFELHLFELAGTESEVAGSDLVAETLADLTYAERHFHARRTLYVEEVDENTLSGFGTQIYCVCAVFGYALEGLEHKVELSYARKFRLAAYGAGDFVVYDILFELFVGPACNALFDALAFHVIFDKVVCAMTRFAALAVHKRIAETAEVSACHPYVGIHEDSAVKSRVERVFLDKLFPPRTLDVVFEFYAQRTVIPCIGESAVNLAACEDETSAFAEGDKFVHCQFCHKFNS